MSDMNINQVLAQMRAMEAQAKAPTGPESLSVNEVPGAQKTDFSEILVNSINSVNEASMNSSAMAREFEKGDSGITMAELMINMEKASVSFQAMTSVRNKLLTAYQEIMNMPV
ncbi:MAG: flagellar hook-basal body complex protein FliE [Gammaproteobacteria bacterium]|nr:flagellar hook-basal body complex protein FliE [Gammaproteobacteria bacterium]